jgi:hypothetical protein
MGAGRTGGGGGKSGVCPGKYIIVERRKYIVIKM